MFLLLGIHAEVDERVESRVGHGEPEEEEEDMLGVLLPQDVLRGERLVLGSEDWKINSDLHYLSFCN